MPSSFLAICLGSIAASTAALGPRGGDWYAWGWNKEAASKARYFPQRQDHFNGSNHKMWLQAYYVNDNHWSGPSSDAPVFLYIGGEGHLSSHSVTHNFVVDWLPTTKAVLFAVEHRYYGCHNASSCPTRNNTPDYSFLSSRQALEDLAAFHQFATAKYGLRPEAKWVAFGGSYPGMLAAFARSMYPDLFHSAVASSAPVIAKFDMNEYYDINSEAYAISAEGVQGSDACYDAIAAGHKDVGLLMTNHSGQQRLAELFPLDVKSAEWLTDRVHQLSFAGDGVASFPAQGNNPRCDTPACGITQICAIMANESGGTPLERLARVRASQHHSVYNSSGYDFWGYQTCTEFAFYQTCELGSKCFFTQGLNTFKDPPSGKRPNDFCTKWNISTNETIAAVDRSNDFYGPKIAAATRIIWPNGDVDPWHGLSHLSPPGKEQPVIWPVRGAHHCAWMSSALGSDQESVKDARAKIYAQVSEWIGLATQIYV